jgi:hypothetical protein
MAHGASFPFGDDEMKLNPNNKYNAVLDRIQAYFKNNGESTLGMMYVQGISVITIEGALQRLMRHKIITRRQVCIKEGSSRVLWAYRLSDQTESLVTFTPEPSRYKGPYKPRDRDRSKEHSKRHSTAPDTWTMDQELEHYKLLRTLPLPPFEGYPELEAA